MAIDAWIYKNISMFGGAFVLLMSDNKRSIQMASCAAWKVATYSASHVEVATMFCFSITKTRLRLVDEHEPTCLFASVCVADPIRVEESQKRRVVSGSKCYSVIHGFFYVTNDAFLLLNNAQVTAQKRNRPLLSCPTEKARSHLVPVIKKS